MAGTLVLDTLQNGAGTASTSADNVINGCAKAWVNYKGTATRAINGSYNVSSVTFNGTGDYTINFTNGLTDANYSVTGACLNTVSSDYFGVATTTSSSVRIYAFRRDTGGLADVTAIYTAVFR